MTSSRAPRSLIVGAAGQDGRLLEALLRGRGHGLLCIDRGAVAGDLGWQAPVDITRADQVAELVRTTAPDEIYHLAAVHHSAEESAREDLGFFRSSYEVNFFSLLSFLDAIRLHAPQARLFYAASSHIFGPSPGTGPEGRQDEATPLAPQSVYAMTKVDGLLACRHYRRLHQVFASVGILYNHESGLREEKFLSRKIVRAVVDIKRGLRDQLVLGDLGAEVDWGYAPDYVEAMRAILAAAEADDFVVATGIKHSVVDFVAAAFQEAGLDWRQHVIESAEVKTRRPQSRIGDATKLRRVTGWRPTIEFSEMVRRLVRDEMTSR
jgi:GDPmannose 4,6-dehydratase